MLQSSKVKHQKFSKGDCVLVTVPKVDRGPADPFNLIALVVDEKNGVYQIATIYGIIKGHRMSDVFLRCVVILLFFVEYLYYYFIWFVNVLLDSRMFYSI
ncbi:hypothetical protein ABEB36_015130 [Hypothenemus hampei]|uniref:Uncharacterized protein n=1 Tax=Hypothenemus hampei TaxID=57062 RepID=A0ABD1E0G9_HYPHA